MKQIKIKSVLGIFSVCLFSAGVGQAATIAGEVSDGYISSTGNTAQGSGLVVNTALNRARSGNWTAGNGQTHAGIFVFQLPDLGMLANPFDTVTFNFNVNAINDSPSYNADLYGIDARSANTVIAADFYVGDVVDPNATLLQDNILTSSSSLGSAASGNIASFLNTQYDSGNNIGDFVFLRLNRDGATTKVDENTGYVVYMADLVNVESIRPFLSYTMVPEPASYALLAGLAGFGLVMIRRRRS